MIWAMSAVVAAILILAILRGRHTSARASSRIEQRVEAYKQTIRRTNEPPRYVEMNDTELSDVLTAAAEKLHTSRQRRFTTMFGAGAATLAVGLFIGLDHGLQAFGIAIVSGPIVTYGVNLVLERRTREWFTANDLNAERLALD